MTPRRVKPRYFFIALVPVCIFLINKLITGQLMATDLNVPSNILQDDRPWLEGVGRFRFLATSWFFASLAVLAVSILVRNLARPTARETRMLAVGTVFVIFLLAIISPIQQNMSPDTPRAYYRLGAAFFETALSRGTLPACLEPDDNWLLGRCGEVPVISLFNRVLDIVTALAGLAVGALIVGMILCLDTCEADDLEQEAARLAKNMLQMRHQLYLSSLVLTFGMLFATSWMHWPLPMVTDSHRAAYGSVVLASSLFTGTYFSLLLLSFYLPVALILDGWVKTLTDKADQYSEGGERLDFDAWKTSHGLKVGLSEHLRSGFALTAPIVAAFAGGIFPVSL